LTRAKNILIVSGVAGTRGASADGVVEGSWYQRMQAVPCVEPKPTESLEQRSEDAPEQDFSLPIFSPPPMPGPAQATPSRSDAIDEGIALHALLERVTGLQQWPINVPEAGSIARWVSCTHEVAERVRTSAHKIFGQPVLQKFFDPDQHIAARNEMDVMIDGELLRFDRIVLFDDEAWILDYKRDLLESERTAYEAQMARYREAAKAVFGGKQIKTALVTADGNMWMVE